MEAYFVLLLLTSVFCPLFSHGPPESSPSKSQDNFKYSSQHTSDTISQADEDADYEDSNCYRYKDLLNGRFPTDYMDSPVEDLRVTFLETKLEAPPDEKYYLAVLKSYDAYERGLIKQVTRKSIKYHHEGIRSEIYLLAPDYFEYRLVSHSDIESARQYFKKKLEDECRTEPDLDQVSEPNRGKKEVESVVKNSHMKCLEIEEIKNFENQMEKIDVNLEPQSLYYKLVLKINRSVHCKQLIVIEGTLLSGALGIKTEEYFVRDDHTKLRLPSVKDKRQARAFFRERKRKAQSVNSGSSSDESTRKK